MAIAESAGDELWAALRERPEDVGLLVRAAQALLVDGDLPAAHGFAVRADELAQTSTAPVLLLADILCRQGDAAAAAEALRARRAQHGASEGFLNRLGHCEAIAGDLAQARDTLHEALVRFPEDAEVHNDLGVVCHGLGDVQCALAHFAAALAADPSHATARANLGDLQVDDRATPGGLESAYADAVARDPGDFAALALLARLNLERDRYRAAGNLLVRMLDLDRDRAQAAIRFGIERLRDACATDDLAIGGAVGAYCRRGLLHHLLRELDQAKICYEQACMREPGHGFAGAMLTAVNQTLAEPDDHRGFALDAGTNIARNRQELEDRAERLDSTPATIEIASTNVCNIDPPCVQCWKHIDTDHGWLNDDARHLGRDLIERLAPFARRAEHVSLHGVGEPLANPHLFETVRWCDEPTAVTFVSNALLFNDARIEKVLQHDVAMIDFSLDAGTAETYRKIRHNDFDKATGNIRALIEERDRRGLSRPRVGINMCLMRENVGDVPAFVQLCHDLGADIAHIFHMNEGASYRFGWFDYQDQLCQNDPETHDRYVEQGFALAEQLGVELVLSGRRRLSVPDDARQHARKDVDTERFFCAKPWTSLLVRVDGAVFNCCWQARPIGHLEQSSTWEIWNGELLQDIRRSTAQGVAHERCKSRISPCPYLGRS